jgi:hypothetical protein
MAFTCKALIRPKVCSKNQNQTNMRKKNATECVVKKRRSCSKYKEFAHMSPVDRPIGQPSLDISAIWTPILAAEVRKLELRPV